MTLACNIEARGKAVRLVMGIVMLFIGLVLLFAWALPTGSSPAWLVTVSVIIGGGFAIFEARAGWCAVRAMGFRTPL
jgi:hypothetical protein